MTLWRARSRARVFVNRVWKWHFGTGIVNSADNFGKVGDPPSDPAELLDYIAIKFQQEWHVAEEAAAHDHAFGRVPAGDSKETPEEHVKDPLNRLLLPLLASASRCGAASRFDAVCCWGFGFEGAGRTGDTAWPRERSSRTVYAKVSRFHIDPFPAGLRLPQPDLHGGAALLNQRAGAAALLHEQSVCLRAGRQSCCRSAYTRRATMRHASPRRVSAGSYGRVPTPAELQAGLEFLKTHAGQAGLPGQPGAHNRVEAILPRPFQFQ